MGIMFKATGFVIYLVLALVTGRRIDRVQSRVQTILISDISPGDDNDQQHRTEGQKKSLFSSLHNLVRNSFDGVDDDDLPLLYVMCQFDFILWKCERLSSRRANQQITDHNIQPETDQNVQTTTDQSKQLETDHNIQPETDQNVQTTTDQIKQLETYHNVQPETDQKVQTTTDQSKELKIYHNVRLKSDKDIQPTTEKPMQHESYNKKDSEIDRNLSLSVEEYEMIEDGPFDPDGMGLAGGLLCQMCSSVKSSAEREKCETRFCDY